MPSSGSSTRTLRSAYSIISKHSDKFGSDTRFVATAEKLTSPYEFGVYDLLVLPESFPYGGMENSCLTFVTPTLIAGDRSEVDVIAHEISHVSMPCVCMCLV